MTFGKYSHTVPNEEKILSAPIFAKKVIEMFLYDATGGLDKVGGAVEEGYVTVTRVSKTKLRLDFIINKEVLRARAR